jgi:MFS family permease
LGLLVGAVFWGVGCDIWGRRYEMMLLSFPLGCKNGFWTCLLDGVSSFNVTLLLAGIFGLAAGGSPNFIALASLLAVDEVGVGGTLKCKSSI